MAKRDPGAQVRVWDPFVRVFHWGMVALFAATYLSPDAKWLHEPLGYAVLVLAAARILWGLVGSRHARFADFVRGPRAVLAYLRQLRHGEAPRYLGHNPAGGAMVALLLAMLVLVAGSGWMTETDRWFGVPWVDHLHHISAHLLLILIGVHVAGVVVSSVLHRENLVLAMWTGRKPAALPGHHPGRESQGENGTAAVSGGDAG
jgi:cytochrome b